MLKKILLGILVVVALGLAAFVVIAWEPSIDEISPPQRTAFDDAAIRRGAQLAGIGDCVVCHTAPGGEPYAGGLGVPTPFGTIYATNITPEPETGIGTWSEAAFVRAMREGIARDGTHLYPAFPYVHYTKATDEDLAALYAFLMTRQPVEATAPSNELPFPLNFRPILAGWNFLFLEKGPYRPDEGQGEEWNRGAYLVASLGHCSSCHSPVNSLGGEERDQRFDGGNSEGWHAPALNGKAQSRAPWTEEALFDYLRHGFSDLHGQSLGPMRDVTASLAAASDEDVRSMAVYLASLAGDAGNSAEDARQFAASREFGPAPSVQPASQEKLSDLAESGRAAFAGSCAICHHEGGVYPAVRPVPLALSSAVTGPDPRNLVHIIEDGVHPPPGEAGPIMPGFAGTLTDDQIAAVAAFVREHFGGKPAWDNLQETVQGNGNEEAS